ncbi:anthranilate synthase component I family protein [Desulfovibrio sp. JC010]|uniref:anthranilate synthase component I family protein n=1 Tax=Desulfovibrio sp. JC010 TaxID=2593641 RepID=UPI0013CFF041|nr:anthranilate synthase component I family protein [Desulfovibrio sp. JC010]NDV25060.1 anthranilate synthase component I family protein [Desulfovibrio sp. JC010]
MLTPSTISDSCSFERFREIAFHFVQEQEADVLLGSPGAPDSCLSYLGIEPQDELVLQPGVSATDVSARMKEFCFADNGPVIGYLSYELGQELRGVESCKAAEFPLLHLKKYRGVLIYDSGKSSLKLLCADETYRSAIVDAMQEICPIPHVLLPSFELKDVRMSLDKQGYEDGVARTLEYIRDGLTYQLNLTTRLSMPGGDVDPVLWFFALHKRYPAPYYALLRSGGKVVVSTSPELFLRVDQGQVLSEPIKGTLRFDEYSEELVESLRSSVKEDSELSMIVDLIRNDISSDCRYGSVVVEDHKSVFAVDNLLQMFSRVRGELAEGRDCIDLLLNAFPGGSITGCPKKSSMELIDRLESHVRGPYCGSIVLITGPQDMVSSIAIRTAVYDQYTKEINYWAGSGIVIDSDPEAEYVETIAKAGKILDPESL